MLEPKPLIAAMHRVSESEPIRRGKVRLDRSERTHPFSEEFIATLRARLDGEWLSTYPEPEPLYEALSGYLGCDREMLLLHSGSDLSIKAVFETYVAPGDRILLHAPSYAMYPVYADMFGAEVTSQSFETDLSFDWDAFIGSIGPHLRMAVVENPNGFIGAAPPHDVIDRFVAACEEHGVIALIDEAYFVFYTDSAARLLDRYENLIIVRTFSKAFGLAGLRVGYTVSRPANISNLRRVKPMHEVNALAVLTATTLLERPAEISSFVEETAVSLAYLKAGFAKLGVATSAAVGNFLAARLGGMLDTDAFREELRARGILVRRPFREPHLAEWVRIGTAPVPVMTEVLETAERLIAANGGTR